MSGSSTRTRSAPLTFQVRSDQDVAETVAHRYPWWVLALAAAGATLLLGWLLAVTVAVIGWFAGPTADLVDTVGIGTRLWLLGHGVIVPGLPGFTLVPLTLTAIIVVVLASMTAVAMQARSDATAEDESPEDASENPVVGCAIVGLVVVGAYAAVVLVVGALLGGSSPNLLISAVAPLVAVVLAALLRLRPLLQARARLVLGAGSAAAAVPAALAVALLVGSLIVRRDQVAALQDALALEGLSVAALVLVQSAFALNAVIWASSYALGPGFGLGDGSVVAPSGVELGLLPALPIFGALPEPGPQPWPYAWIAVLALTGVGAAAAVRLIGRNRTGGDRSWVELTAVSAGAGAFAGVLWLVLGTVSSGDLGTGRLVDLGPQMQEMLILVPGSICLAAALAQLAITGGRYLLRRR